MALNIPMPGAPGDAFMRGADTGSTLMNRLISQRQGQQNIDLSRMQQDRMQTLLPYQIQNYELQQQLAPFQQQLMEAQAREAQTRASLSPFQQQLMEAQAREAQTRASLSPFQQQLIEAQAREAQTKANLSEQDVSLLQSLLAMQQGGAGAAMNQQGAATDQQGGGYPVQPQEMNPVLAQLYKKRIGVDPNAMTPSQEAEFKFDQFKREQDYKLRQPKDVLTSGAQTEIQKQINDLDVIIPMVKDLQKSSARGWGAGARKFQTKVTDTVDRYISAVKAPKDKESRHDIRQMLDRRWNETDGQYRDRIQSVLKTLKSTKSQLQSSLGGSRQESQSNTGMLIGTINGKKVRVSPENRPAFEQQGGVIDG